MYDLYREKYLYIAKNGITLDLYLKILQRFSIYIHFLPKNSKECDIVYNFFKKQPVSDLKMLFKLPRKYIFMYISSVKLLENTEFTKFFLNMDDLNEEIYKREIFKFTSDIFSDLIRNYYNNSHKYNISYYISLVNIIAGKKEILSHTDIYFLILFAAVFSKKELFNHVSKMKLAELFNKLDGKMVNRKILLTLLTDVDIKTFVNQLTFEFDTLSLDSKFIILSYMYSIKMGH